MASTALTFLSRISSGANIKSPCTTTEGIRASSPAIETAPAAGIPVKWSSPSSSPCRSATDPPTHTATMASGRACGNAEKAPAALIGSPRIWRSAIR